MEQPRVDVLFFATILYSLLGGNKATAESFLDGLEQTVERYCSKYPDAGEEILESLRQKASLLRSEYTKLASGAPFPLRNFYESWL